MKDPCLECLVRVTCWQECGDKKNYATLLANALKQFQCGDARIKYNKQFRHYVNLSHEHIVRRNKINKRASSMSKDK